MQNQKAQSFKPLTISAEELPASMARHEKLTGYAAARAKLLLGCYRTGEANDPETYVAAVTAVLAHYPEEVITNVTHPVTGLPSKKSWLPTVKEVSDACAEVAEPIAREEMRLKQIKDQLEAREMEARGERPTLKQMKARHGDNWGLTSLDDKPEPKDKAPTIDQLRHHYQHYGLGFTPKQELAEHIERGFSPSTAE